MKARNHKDYTASILEEIIEYNLEIGIITRSIQIMERATNDLKNLLQIWGDKEKRSQYQEYYTQEKLAYYMFQTMKVVDYLDSVNIHFGDIKPANLLIFRN